MRSSVMRKCLISTSMMYPEQAGRLVDAGQRGALESKLNPTPGLHTTDTPFAAAPDTERNGRRYARASSDQYYDHNNRQHDFNKQPDNFYRQCVILLAIGCADSFDGDGAWSESCGDTCSRRSDQEKTSESNANSAASLSTMPGAGQPIRRRLSELPHPALPSA
jgi:hypothetical protein